MPILRKYNYNLETGTVGTDDDNIANILYNINRMEMKVSFSTDDVEELKKTLGELYAATVDCKVNLFDFVEIFDEKLNADTLNEVCAVFDEAMKCAKAAIRAACSNEVDTKNVAAAFPSVYKMLLDIVPSVLALEAQITNN